MKPKINVPEAIQAQVETDGFFNFMTSVNAWPKPPDIEKPSPEGRTGILFSGINYENIPRRLFLDNRTTPLELKCWGVFKMMLDKQGIAVPRYDDLQPYLSMCPGKKASRVTVARSLAILRLTRWITLVDRGRDGETGQIRGCMYLLNDEPISIEETLEFDREFIEFTTICLSHNNKAIRIAAECTKQDIESAAGYFPTRLEIMNERMNGIGQKHDLVLKKLFPTSIVDNTKQLEAPGSELEPCEKEPSFDLELGKKQPSSNSGLSQNLPGFNLEPSQNSPSSNLEPGEKPTKTDTVPNRNSANQYSTSTVLSTFNKSTVLYRTNSEWPVNIILTDKDRAQIAKNLTTLPPDIQRMVLNEASARIKAGNIRNHAGYLYSLINRAKDGKFKLWAGTPTETQGMTKTNCATGAVCQQHNQNAPEMTKENVSSGNVCQQHNSGLSKVPPPTPPPIPKPADLPVSTEIPPHVREKLAAIKHGRRNLN